MVRSPEGPACATGQLPGHCDRPTMTPFDPDVFARVPTAIGIAHDPGATWITVNPHFASLLGIEPQANASLGAGAAEAPAYKVFRHGRRLSADELPLQLAARTNTAVSEWEAEIVRPDG